MSGNEESQSVQEQNQPKEQSRSAIGLYRPPFVQKVTKRAETKIYADLAKIPGLTATISDVLDELGYRLAVPATKVPPIVRGKCVVGPALTLRYLPERRVETETSSRLAHQFVFSKSSAGDIVVIEGDPRADYSVLGGLAAVNAKKAGLAAVLVDGAVRDVDQIIQEGFYVWARGITCITGRGRLEGFSVNLPVSFCGVQVHPGDIVAADDSGICFIPPEILDEVCQRVLAIYNEELKMTQE